jgi:hypothetical protein
MDVFNKKTYNRIYRENNLDKITKREKAHRDNNRELINKKARDYSTKVRLEKGDVYKKLLERKKIHSIRYRKEKASLIKENYEKKRGIYNENRRLKYALSGSDKKVILTDEQRVKKNESNRRYAKRIRKEGKMSEFTKFKLSVRRRTAYAFNRIKINKPYNTEILIGIKLDDLKDYIESKFTEGMNWSNRNLWHIDHIIPLASAKTEEEMIKLCHYTNLQPLWAIENMSKGSKIITIKTIENEY